MTVYSGRPAGAARRGRTAGLILVCGLVLSGCTSTSPNETSATTSSESVGSVSAQPPTAISAATTSGRTPTGAEATSTRESADPDNTSVMSWPASLPDLVEQLQP